MKPSIFLFACALASVGAASVPAYDTSVWHKAHGMSMYPLIQPGDEVKVEAVPFGALPAYVASNPDTVVVFYNYFASRGRNVTHHTALYFNSRGVLVTKGHNNPKRDLCGVTARNYYGVVTHVKRGGVVTRIAGAN